MSLKFVFAAGLVAVAALGCAAQRWTRAITPFPVRDSAGTPLDHAFLGGFNVPRPQLVDIDADGDADLFVQEAPDAVMFFERAGGRWTWRTDRFQELAIGEWLRFADLDDDGDPDVLAELPHSYVRYFRNDDGRFTAVGDTVRQANGEPVFADRQNIPQLGDIDCNDVPDLMIGSVTGTVARYERSGMVAGRPRFALLAERFEGIEIIGTLAGSLHGANTMAVTDVDADGDADLVWGDFFEPGLLLIENTGTCAAPSLRGRPVPFPRQAPVRTSGYNAPTFADVDGDGRLDMVMGVLGGAFNPTRTTVDNLYYARGGPEASFTVTTTRLIRMIDVGAEAVPALVDLDGDADLDLLVANKISPHDPATARIHVFENVGTPRAPALAARAPLAIAGAYHYAPTFGDLDGDGRIDMLLGGWGNRVRWLQAAEGRWHVVDSALVTITRGSNTTPSLGDVDGDGDLDLVIGEASGNLNLYRNDGTPTAPAFTLVSDEWLAFDPGRRSAPQLVDLDADGRLDLVVGSEDGTLWLLRNTASGFGEPMRLPVAAQPLATPAFGDLDADGTLELIVGSTGGGLLYFRMTR